MKLKIIFFIVILISTILPRTCLLGYFPTIDESYYSFFSKSIYLNFLNNYLLPNFGGIMLYQILTSWIYSLSGISLIYLRLIDLLLAILSAILFIYILKKESGSYYFALIVGFITLCILNQPLIISAGYRNSIIFSTIPFFFAIYLVKDTLKSNSNIFIYIGALVAVAVLIREPFCLFSILGLLSCYIGWGYKAALKYTFGGIITSIVILTIIIIFRGDAVELLRFYTQEAVFFADKSYKIINHLCYQGYKSSILFIGPISLLIFLLFFLIKNFNKSIFLNKKFLFWICVTIIPLIEPILKYGFVYHFSNCLYGIAGLSAFAWRKANLTFLNLLNHKIAISLIILCCIFSIIKSLNYYEYHKMTLDLLQIWPTDTWPKKYENQSNALYCGAILRKYINNKTTLSSSGDAFFIYDVTKTFPPTSGKFNKMDVFRMGDLSRMFVFLHKNEKDVKEYIQQNPPDILLIAKTNHLLTYNEQLSKIINTLDLYKLEQTIDFDKNKDYGWYSFDIYLNKYTMFK